ncbi:MAG: HAMP domain-containing histidine kinase, partial [Deltaproteobacteria bacterium]|nr:HAMP domain-containing histidine kinase [Deltaproteobacteria bacterium]
MQWLLSTICALLFCLHSGNALAGATLSGWNVRLLPNGWSADHAASRWTPAADLVISKKYVGYIEYTADLHITTLDPNDPLGIDLSDISDSDKTYVNGTLIGSTGSFPPAYQGYIDYPREYLIPTESLSTSHANQLRILVYVEYPAKKGVHISAVRVGSHAELQHRKFFREVAWYATKLLMPFLCAILAIIVFLSLKALEQKAFALIYIGIAVSFCLFGISRSRISFHLFDVVTAYKILILSNIVGVTLILFHAAQAATKKQHWIHALIFLPLCYFASRVLLETSVNVIFMRYEPWFYIGTLMLVASAVWASVNRHAVGVLFVSGVGLLTFLGVYDTILSMTKIRLPYLFDVGISVLILCMLGKHIMEIRNSYTSITHQQIKLQAQANIAAQVAHDIRSPLTALRVVAGHLAEVGEEKRVMIRNAVQRIEDIANDLAGRKAAAGPTGKESPAPEHLSVQLLSSLIEPLISEKRMQLRARLGVEIGCALDASAYGLFARVQPVECKRLLSNVINNAVEALDGAGTVTVTLGQADDVPQIIVADTGHGIPPDVLPRLMQRGATFGKAGGSGLGLFHARTTVERWGGTLALASTVGHGTTVTVTLPPAEAPG